MIFSGPKPGGSHYNITEEGAIRPKFQLEEQQQISLSPFETPYDLAYNSMCSPIQLCHEEVIKLQEILTLPVQELAVVKKEKTHQFPLASLGLLNNFGSRLKCLNSAKFAVPATDSTCATASSKGLSTTELVALAGTKFLWFPSQRVVGLSMSTHPFGSSLSGLSYEQTKDVELIQLLLASAEKVEHQQFSCALKLLDQCYLLSSNAGNPAQRLVYYFCEALQERINRENRDITLKRSRHEDEQFFFPQDGIIITSPDTAAYFQQIPFLQIAQFTGTQAILEQVDSAKKVHVIDLRIRSGVQWIVFLQALAAQRHSSLELLKITAVTTSEGKIDAVRKQLLSIAESINLPFSFEVLMVTKMNDIDEELLKPEDDELVAVYSPYYLSTLIARPDHLESLMRVVKSLRPSIMVVLEVEANHNSALFLNRFVSALFHHSAHFNCLDVCMKGDDLSRMSLVKTYHWEGIRNIVAFEGDKRRIRHVNIDTWRSFFPQFGMAEVELSMSSLLQADLLIKNFACGNLCTLGMNRKSLLIGWKGTPLFSVSAWKILSEFNHHLSARTLSDHYSECSSSNCLGEAGVENVKQTVQCGAEDWVEWMENNFLWSELGCYQDRLGEAGTSLSGYEQQEQQLISPLGSGNQDDYSFGISSPLNLCQEEILKLQDILIPPPIPEPADSKKKNDQSFPVVPDEVTNNSGFDHLNGENIDFSEDFSHAQSGRQLSTIEIICLGGAKFMQSSSGRVSDLFITRYPFGLSFSGLSEEVIKEVMLIQLLLASAEKVGRKQYSSALKMLGQCDVLSSSTGSPVQRVAYYFSEALLEKIGKETGRIRSKRLTDEEHNLFHPQKATIVMSLATVAHFLQIPFPQVAQFAGVQAIIEHVGSAKRVHIIDFLINCGVRWVVFMQGLAARYGSSVELLKITAVTATSKDKIEEIGKKLASSAEYFNLSFSFEVLELSNLKDIEKELFKVETDEAIAVYSPYYMSSLIAQPDCLESLMRVIESLNPCIMVVTEVEANHNSPIFISRFAEALYYHSAYFECIDTCMHRNDLNRITLERKYIWEGIRNIVASEREERVIRHVKLDVWRDFFMQFGMAEAALSTSSLDQAALVLKNFTCGNFCTLSMDNKSLLIGWKGTQIHSVSAWKFT
ncbi:Transcription factor GRAS [Dillenia turbinata]|uniref:Transcription factor GRAS n=1 Tax=Dillenia turbinata TaxID=194707 RepID=A0AAN8UPM8_9MAGN